jgi:hypothetical protein
VDKSAKIHAEDVDIAVKAVSGEDYISLTDMARHAGAVPGDVIRRWLRLSDTIQFLSAWEHMSNPNFDQNAARQLLGKSGKNIFSLSTVEWVSSTKAIGIRASRGRSGGTYAHKDIAFAFASWISPEFHLFVIKDYERLKIAEQGRLGDEWNARRELVKTNYKLHTDAVKEILAEKDLPRWRERIEYASEADLINLAVFGQKASTWKKDHPGWGGNMRDYAPVRDLVILQNIEAYSGVLITQGFSKQERFEKMLIEVSRQRESLKTEMRSIEKLQQMLDSSAENDDVHRAIGE